MKITKAILTNNPCYKAGKTMKVKGLMLHSVGCSQPSAMVFVKSWNTSGKKVCVHGFIDGNTGEVYQTLPWEYQAWHSGGTLNGTHIGIEMCEPACIKYTSGSKFTCSDTDTARAIAERTYKSAVELFAHLCEEYSLNPLTDGVILSHSEGYRRGLASNHGDPEHLWKGLKLPYTMDGFRQDVKSAMKPTLYKVQVGAFSKKQNAENLLSKLKILGFEGFIVKQ
jgi:N-acetyl-anhydromuramyl-L-alanine amidase AmpD